VQLQAGLANGHPPGVEYERELVICCLDLISGLADGVGPPLAPLVVRGQLRSLLVQCCRVPLL